MIILALLFLPFLLGLSLGQLQSIQRRDDPPKSLCYALGLRPAFYQWAGDCPGVLHQLESMSLVTNEETGQYTSNYSFNTPKDYIWIMNEKCSIIIYQSNPNKSIAIPEVPMPTVVSWAKDYIFGDCVGKNLSGSIFGVGENKTNPFGMLKTVVIPSNVAVQTWWEIMGWPSHALSEWLFSKSDPGSFPKASETFGRLGSCFNASEVFDIWALPKPDDFQQQPLVPNDCQGVISILQEKYANNHTTETRTFGGVETRIREDSGICTALIWNMEPNITTILDVDMATVVTSAKKYLLDDCIAGNNQSGIWVGVGEDPGWPLATIILPKNYADWLESAVIVPWGESQGSKSLIEKLRTYMAWT
ncbi:hypothetical protein B0T21DRAFT_284396 [Apiosordaria backusii]|uniref:Uncharacterized protein n=1 Tax=Apiosordaria backusii TaxID=314023 RepID=A0AA40BRY4_9PEZI|nr:hypothetical protein B0T21DRAFT_284396 [Apiosordaria backusii]